MAPLRAFAARVFVGYFLVLGVASYVALGYFGEAIKPAVRQTMEEVLVEESALLASFLEGGAVTGAEDIEIGETFREALRGLAARPIGAEIYGVEKTEFRQRVYVTDARGVVVFDSTGRDVGADYSRWNDVARTLAGGYGARSSHEPSPQSPATLFVAAPIRKGGRIAGVVTVAKPVSTMDPFLSLARSRLLRAGGVVLAVSLGVGLLFAVVISRSISRLRDYATRVASGERAPLPALRGELSELAAAIESMRTSLEGKHYVEKTIQSMAHELRSPLSAVVGAAELLEGPIGDADRERFAARIGAEARRMQDLIERLLELSVLEQRRTLKAPRAVGIAEVFTRLGASRLRSLEDRALRLVVEGDAEVHGEALLVEHALGNLLDNAISFAERGTAIDVASRVRDGRVATTVENRGPSIPDFAEGRIFERFYSVPRPDTQRRSTGLGLAFVRQVADLHRGEIRVENVDGGVRATLELPAFTRSS